MSDELKLEHKTLDEAINYHSTWFEYHLNLAHMVETFINSKEAPPTSYYTQLERAAAHANILRELRYQKGLEYQREAYAKMDAAS